MLGIYFLFSFMHPIAFAKEGTVTRAHQKLISLAKVIDKVFCYLKAYTFKVGDRIQKLYRGFCPPALSEALC